MARNIIRAIPMYINGKKIAAVTAGSYDLMSGAGEMFGCVDGYLGHSTGWPSVKITPQVIVPVKGWGAAIENFLIEGTQLQIGLPINGRFHLVDVRVIGVSYKWDFKTGSHHGEVTFEGGQPQFAQGTTGALDIGTG